LLLLFPSFVFGDYTWVERIVGDYQLSELT